MTALFCCNNQEQIRWSTKQTNIQQTNLFFSQLTLFRFCGLHLCLHCFFSFRPFLVNSEGFEKLAYVRLCKHFAIRNIETETNLLLFCRTDIFDNGLNWRHFSFFRRSCQVTMRIKRIHYLLIGALNACLRTSLFFLRPSIPTFLRLSYFFGFWIITITIYCPAWSFLCIAVLISGVFCVFSLFVCLLL